MRKKYDFKRIPDLQGGPCNGVSGVGQPSIVVEWLVHIPLLTVEAALLLTRFCRNLTKEVMVDERVSQVDARPAAISFRVFSWVGAQATLVLIALRCYLPPGFAIAGEMLAYSICALMLLHLAFYSYKTASPKAGAI